MDKPREIAVNVPVLARVEGEGALELKVKGSEIEELRLRIFEPPRLFEKFLEGRYSSDVLDTVARICGICPIAYQMSAVHAIEQAFGIRPGPWVREMRRLFYCGEWLQSHALHIHLLAAPDFLQYQSAIEMARDYPEEVRRGLKLQALGNSLIKLFGARSVHPVGARVGGFFHAPEPQAMASMLQQVREAIPEAIELVRWVGSLDLPDDEQDFISVSLQHPDEYPMNEGRIATSTGLAIDIGEYPRYFREHQSPHSTAFHSHIFPNGVDAGEAGLPYLVGPIARLNLNREQLPRAVLDVLAETGAEFPSRNMFHSALARAVEIHYALLEAERILENYTLPTCAAMEALPRAGVGYGATEAPRGLLWHRYEFDEKGRVMSADIIPPTSQNQARIEEDLARALTAYGFDRSDDELRLRGETVIRNYDPCISCSTHFLTLKVDRR